MQSYQSTVLKAPYFLPNHTSARKPNDQLCMASSEAEPLKLHAVAIGEPVAAFVLIQRQSGKLPPTQNVDLAALNLLAAVQFSGKSAIDVQFVQYRS